MQGIARKVLRRSARLHWVLLATLDPNLVARSWIDRRLQMIGVPNLSLFRTLKFQADAGQPQIHPG